MLKRIPTWAQAASGVFLIILLIGAITFFATSVIGRTAVDQFRVQQLQISTSVAAQMEAYFNELTIEAIRLTEDSTIKSVARSREIPAKEAIETNITENGRQDVVSRVVRFSLDGEPRYQWPDTLRDIDELPYGIPEELVEQTRDGGEVELEEHLSSFDVDGNPIYLLIVPLLADSGNTEYLVYELDTVEIFNTVLRSTLRDLEETETGQMWIFDYDGRLIFQARDEPTVAVAYEVFDENVLELLDEGDSRTFTADDDVEREAALAPFNLLDRKLVVLLSRDTSEAQSEVTGDLRIILGIAVVAGLLITGLALETSRRFMVESSRRQSESSMRRATRSLLEVSRALNSSLELQTVLNRILDELKNLIPYYSASILLLNNHGELEVAAHGGEEVEFHEHVVFRADEARAAREVIARGHPVIIENTAEDDRWTPLPNSKTRSWIGLPLRIFDRSVGVLNINSEHLGGFSSRELELAEAFSDQASVALQNARLHEREVTRIEQELTVAQNIQVSLLPSTSPEIPGLEIAFSSLPAQQVSGDYFQLIPLPDGKLGIFVGDVSGKGMPAALIMAVITTALRDEVTHQQKPGELLNRLNERLLDRLLQNQMNSALIAAVYDPQTHQIAIANAGMVQPYWRQEDTPWDFVDVGGYPLGASKHTNYSSKVLEFTSGSLMVLFSDGIIEAQNVRGEFFGFERLEVLLESMPTDISANDALQQVLTAVEQHLGAEDAQDDVTMMVIRSLEVETEIVETPVSIVPDNGKEALEPVADIVESAHYPEPRKRDNEEYLMPRENVELFLPSVLGFEKVARSAAEAIALKMGFSDDRIDDLKTAVAEACMNAIEHGNLGDKATSVTVLLSASSDHLEVRVVDRGRRQIPDPLPPPGNSEDSRGWGMFFIQNLMDEVEILRSPEGNVVRMTIFLGKEDSDRSTAEPS